MANKRVIRVVNNETPEARAQWLTEANARLSAKIEKLLAAEKAMKQRHAGVLRSRTNLRKRARHLTAYLDASVMPKLKTKIKHECHERLWSLKQLL